MKKIITWQLSFLIIIISSGAKAKTGLKALTSFTERNRFHISSSIMIQNADLVTVNSLNSIAGQASFSMIAQNISGEYILNNYLSVVGSYFFALSIGIDAEVQGFGGGISYFPLGNASSKEVLSLGNRLETYPTWSPYLYIGASTRNFQFSTVNLQFKGIEGKLGLNWQFKKTYNLKLTGSYQKLSNNNSRTLTISGVSIGIGRQF